MWKDSDGKIVTKKPAVANDVQKPQRSPRPQNDDPLQALAEFALFASHEEGAPISPPISHNASLSNSIDDHDSGIASAYPTTTLDPNALSTQSYSPIGQRFWSTDLSQPEPDPFTATAAFDDAPFDEIFNPDTASSFNNPFTTMNNYNWLFDLDLAQMTQAQQPTTVHDPFSSFAFSNNVSQPSHAFDLQLEHLSFEKPLSTSAEFGSLPSQRTDSVVHQSPTAPMVNPPLSQKHHSQPSKVSAQLLHLEGVGNLPPTQHQPKTALLLEVERPMSMLQPSRSLPIIDELARQQILDLIDITQPTAPDGSIVMRDHPLLSLSCLQMYCDLFWTRFNTTYPLLHMSTFEPSHVDTLLLTTVLLLGATYGEKDAHQLAVRPERFNSAIGSC